MSINNIAWSYLLACDRKVLEKAFEYSYQAMQLNSKHPAILSTRGSILIEIGEIDDGINLLKKCVNIHHPLDRKN